MAEEQEEESPKKTRSSDLLGRKNSPLRKHLDEVFDHIHKGFQDQADRSDGQMDWWDCYNCVLNANQFYQGNAEIYVPIVRDAVNARATRFVNQMFPDSGRYLEAVSADGKQPADILSLLDNYIHKRKLKTKVARPLSINGDIEGQYNLYVDWNEVSRWIVTRDIHGPMVEVDGASVEMDGEDIKDLMSEKITEGAPGVEVLHDSDVLVLPATAESIEDALERGGSATIVRRWSKADIQRMIDEDEIRSEEGKNLLEAMRAAEDKDVGKKLNEAVGIVAKGTQAVVWETWKKLPLSDRGYSEDGDKKLCRVWFGPDKAQLGCKRNPYWNDLCPLLSEPPVKIAGVFKGQSPVDPIAPLQYEANDAANEGADSSHYAAMPLMRVSPDVQAPIILNLGAVLRADAGQLEMIQFPDLTPRAISRISLCTTAIFQSLGINPAMLPQQTGKPGAKRNQAEVALELQVDVMTTAEAVTGMEDLFNDVMGWWVDLDHQFRDRNLAVRMFGILGKDAQMSEIPPQQNRARYEFRWLGAETARNAAKIQQQIGGINVLKGFRAELMQEGYRLKVAPILETWAMGLYGARAGALIIEDMRHQSSLDPQLENQLIAEGHVVPVQPLDQDVEHIKDHMQAAQQTGDPLGGFKLHIAAHMQQMQQKVAAQAQQAMQQQMQQRGGAQPQGPRQGAMPAGPRLVAQQPPGRIHPDQMARAGAVQVPRKM